MYANSLNIKYSLHRYKSNWSTIINVCIVANVELLNSWILTFTFNLVAYSGLQTKFKIQKKVFYLTNSRVHLKG